MRILVISYFLGQTGRASSHHIDDRLLELSERGITIGVVGPPHLSPVSCAFLKNVSVYSMPDRRVKSFLRRYLSVKVPPSLKMRVRALLDRIKFVERDRFADWNWEDVATRYVLNTVSLDEYDLIYSTGGPAVAHLVAHNLIKHCGLKWIAEIQDPLIFDGIRTHYRPSQRDLEKLSQAEFTLRSADALICVTETCKQYYRQKLPKEHVYCIYPGSNIGKWYTGDLTRASTTRSRTCFFHAGSLIGTRTIKPFLDAVLQLHLQEKIELVLAGYIDPQVSQLVQKYSSFIRYIGRVSRLEIAEKICAADVCLVVQHLGPISSLTIPSKFYDYAALGATILFLGYKNEEVAANSHQYNFYYADQSSLSDMARTLRVLVESTEPRKTPLTVNIGKSVDEFLALCARVTAG